MAKEFSCFRNISAIQQSSNVNTRRGKFESNWIFCSFIICYRIRYIMICWYSKAPSFRGNSKIRSLPPTRDALIQHIYKAAYVFGYVWGTSHIPARMKDSRAKWAQSFTSVSYSHRWLHRIWIKLYLKSVDVGKVVKRIANARN